MNFFNISIVSPAISIDFDYGSVTSVRCHMPGVYGSLYLIFLHWFPAKFVASNSTWQCANDCSSNGSLSELPRRILIVYYNSNRVTLLEYSLSVYIETFYWDLSEFHWRFAETLQSLKRLEETANRTVIILKWKALNTIWSNFWWEFPKNSIHGNANRLLIEHHQITQNYRQSAGNRSVGNW